MKRRTSVVLLLLLLPFTMAPRTSLTDEHAPLQVSVVVSQTDVDPGERISVVVQARNDTGALLEDARLEVSMAWSGKDPQSLVVPRVPRGCRLAPPPADSTEWVLTCALGDLPANRSVSVAYLVIPPGEGQLVLRAGGFGTAGNTGAPTATVVVGDGTP